MENFTNIIHKLCRVYNVRKEALDHLKKSRKKKKNNDTNGELFTLAHSCV